MITFPNAKINLGLNVVRRRSDGYHDIATVMVPVAWRDILEIVPAADGSTTTLTVTGRGVACAPEKNLVMTAYRAMQARYGDSLGPVDIHLHKVIPDGAGLGGGSADASFAIKAANELAGLGLSDSEMASVAARVGADCAFFIYNRPMLARGIGDVLTPVDASAFAGLGIAIVKPEAEAVSTREAYGSITPTPLEPGVCLETEISRPVDQWHVNAVLVNDFEAPIAGMRPAIASVLRRMRGFNPLYCAMSGSGAAVFGIFDNAKMAEQAAAAFTDCRTFASTLPGSALK